MAARTDARRIALDVLDRVLGRGQPFDETFAGHPRLVDLETRDRAFARLLITTTLRRLGEIDHVLGSLIARPPKEVRVRNILRLGAAQLLLLRTPAHAAVGETVALARGRESYAKGLINAVLRRLAREGETLRAGHDAARLNTPDWLWRSWSAAYGEERARAIAEVHLEEPPLDLSVKDDPSGWAERLDARLVHDNSLRCRDAGPIEQLPGYAEGAWWVQDTAAALPARLFGDVRTRRVIDLCAAPGGKTAQLAAMGAAVTAVEVSDRRASRLRANLARLRLAADVVIGDALEWRPEEPVPFVLLDAPCTATGTIRRHPDVARHKTGDDVVRMAALQERLLAAAAAMLSLGGLLVYASCSLQPEEGVGVIESSLAAGLPLRRLAVDPAEIDRLPVEVTADGDLRALPCHLAGEGGLDGFFIARLERL